MADKWAAETGQTKEAPLRRVVRRKSSGSIPMPSEPDSRLYRKERSERRNRQRRSRNRFQDNPDAKPNLLDAMDPIEEMRQPPSWYRPFKYPKQGSRRDGERDRKPKSNKSRSRRRNKKESPPKDHARDRVKESSSTPKVKGRKRQTTVPRIEFTISSPMRGRRSSSSGEAPDSASSEEEMSYVKNEKTHDTKTMPPMFPIFKPITPPPPPPPLRKQKSRREVKFEKVEFSITAPGRKSGREERF